MSPALIVVGGGSGTRLGGVSKPDLEVHGRRLLDIVLGAGEVCAPRVAVVPPSVRVPSGTLRTIEDPPDGGPVAGVAAGLLALRRCEDGEGAGDSAHEGDVVVLACDLPGAGALVGPLLAARAAHAQGSSTTHPRADGAIALQPDGRRAMLAFVAARTALERALADGGSRDRSMRSLLATLDLEEVTVPAGATEDIDTWDQLTRWETQR